MVAEATGAPFLHASQHAPGGTDPVLGVVAADIDSAISFWDDPLGIGFAATCLPTLLNGVGGVLTANRAVFHRFISGGTVAKLYYGVNVSSGNHDLGIYANTGSREAALPSARTFSTGSIPVPSTGNATVVVSPTVIVKARQHWSAIAPDNATANFWLYGGVSAQQANLCAGWSCYKDTSFPLPNPLTSPTLGLIRHICIVGRPS